MTDATAELVLLAGKLVRHLRRDAGVPASYRVLAVLEETGPVGISQLAAADGISQPTMSTQVATLVAGGLVERSPHPSDARAQVLTITDAGREHLRTHRARLVDAVRGRLGDHSDADIATAIAVLKSLTEKGNA